MASKDKIIVAGIKFHGYHGFTALERQVGVRCSIDVELVLDLEAAGRSDALEDTIDYRKVHDLVLSVGTKERSFHLIEALALHMADRLLKEFRVQEVTVRVRKETPVLDGIVDSVGAEVTRSG